MTIHTERCKRQQNERAAWIAAHPNFCRACEGWGVVAGGDYCPVCIGNGRCPHCGHQHGEGWNKQSFEPCERCRMEPGGMLVSDNGAPVVDCECWLNDGPTQAEIEAANRRRWERLGVVLDDAFFRRADMEFDMARERGLRW